MFQQCLKKKAKSAVLFSEFFQKLKYGLGVPPFGNTAFKPAQVPSLLGRGDGDVGVAVEAVERHGGVAHNGVIFRHDDQSLMFHVTNLVVLNRKCPENFFCPALIPENLRGNLLMKLSEIPRFSDLLHVDDSRIFPKFHFWVFEDSFLNISFDKKFLIDGSHVSNDFSDVDWRCQSNQSLDISGDLVSHKVAEEIVASKAGPYKVDGGVGVMYRNSAEGSLKFIVLDRGEGDRTGHLIVDSATVEANTVEAFSFGLIHNNLDVVHFAATRESMHNEKNGRIVQSLIISTPVERNMASILEEQPLAFKFVIEGRLIDVVAGLQERVGQVRSWGIRLRDCRETPLTQKTCLLGNCLSYLLNFHKQMLFSLGKTAIYCPFIHFLQLLTYPHPTPHALSELFPFFLFSRCSRMCN